MSYVTYSKEITHQSWRQQSSTILTFSLQILIFVINLQYGFIEKTIKMVVIVGEQLLFNAKSAIF